MTLSALTDRSSRIRLSRLSWRGICLCLIVLTLSACVGWKASKSKRYDLKNTVFSIYVPAGWYSAPLNAKRTLTLTKDGEDIQRVLIRKRLHEDAFEHIEKSSSLDQLPQVLLEKFIADTKVTMPMDTLEVLSHGPALIAGKDGFQLDLAFRSSEGVRFRERIYGMASPLAFYTIEYRAPALYYFDRDVDEFDEIVAGLQIRTWRWERD
ncbi:MAG: hypothetical protein AAF465_14445 [Pseudomonadota bacterium]